MNFHFETYSLIQFVTALAALATIVILWKYRKNPGVKYYIYLDFFVAIWAFTYAFEFSTPFLDKKILWSQLSYLGIAYMPLCYFLFTTGFSQKTRLITKRNILLLSIIPTATLIFVLTNGYHHWVWTNVTLDKESNIAQYYHGIWFWIFYIYTELMLLSGLYNLFSSIYRFPAHYKSQIYTLLIGSVLPIAGNLMYVFRINPIPGFDWTPVSFVFTGFIVSFGVINFKIFDLVPIARTKLLDIINDCIVVVNKAGLIEDYNPAVAKHIKSESKNFIGEPFEAILPGFKMLVDFWGSRQEQQTEISVDEDGKHFDYHVLITPLFNQTKDFSGHLLILHDITAIKKTEKKLTETNQRLLGEIEKKEKLISDLDAFAHTVAHGLKNPIGAIMTTSDLMKEGLESMDREYLAALNEMIGISATKSFHITNELLTLSSVRQQEIELAGVDMLAIINEAISQLGNMINDYKAQISVPAETTTVTGYGPWLEEVWVNFISNAIKYGGTPPQIEIGEEKLNGLSIKFWIKDNGNGFPPKQQEQLFNQFTRFDPGKAHGHGLGLSIVKRIIEKQGGQVGAFSEGEEGKGAEFFFILKTTNEQIH